MHMVEQMLGETHFQRVTRDLFKKSNPTMNQKLFKKLLKDIGIKFDEIQQNWINSTSCPQIECAFTYNKKNNSVDITLEQHSILKH
jgi:aminopeptidase N